jgi:hypothetical protein
MAPQTTDRPPAAQEATVSDSGPRARRRSGWAVAVAALAAAVAAIAAFAVVRDDGRSDDESVRAPSTTAPPTPDPAPATPGPSTVPSAPTTPAPVLEDGPHAVTITGIDADAGTLEVDVVQFLTGDAAIAAWQENYPDESGGPPNDYYIVNENPRLRVLPVAEDVTVTVIDGVERHAIAWADFPARLDDAPMRLGNTLWPNPFWLRVSDGVIVDIEEQYIP